MSTPVRILLAEDSIIDAELTTLEIRKALPDCTVHQVDTRPEFLSAMSSFEPDIIISDYSMPSFDGMTALTLAKAHAPLTPVIIVTGAINEDTAVACMKSGAVDYVIKEHIKRLGQAVVAALEQRDMRIARLQAERDLLKSEERYRRFFEDDLSGIYLSTPRGDVLACNPAFVRIMGYQSAEEVMHTNASHMYAVSDQRKEFLDLLAARGRLINYECALVRHDGTRINVVENVVGVFEDGQLVEFRGYLFDVTEQKRAEDQLRSNLREKEALLREMHHRVKNNLQVISSLLNMQVARTEEESHRLALLASEHRIRSMALVHETLYQTNNFGAIDLGTHIRELCRILVNSYGRSAITTRVEAEQIELPIDTAVPCGLIANELITNALKHAFPHGGAGTISIRLRRDGDVMAELSVEDDGIGFPAPEDFRTMNSMGMSIINSLVEQIRGEVRIDTSHGTTVVVRFPRE